MMETTDKDELGYPLYRRVKFSVRDIPRADKKNAGVWNGLWSDRSNILGMDREDLGQMLYFNSGNDYGSVAPLQVGDGDDIEHLKEELEYTIEEKGYEVDEVAINNIQTHEDLITLLDEEGIAYTDLNVLHPVLEATTDVDWDAGRHGDYGFCSMEGAPLYVSSFVHNLVSKDRLKTATTVGDVRTEVTKMLTAMVSDDDAVYGIREVNKTMVEYFVRLWLALEYKVVGDAEFVSKYGKELDVDEKIFVSNWSLYYAEAIDEMSEASMIHI